MHPPSPTPPAVFTLKKFTQTQKLKNTITDVDNVN